MKKLLFTYLVFLFFGVNSSGQQINIDPVSFFDRALPYYNPAGTGMEEALTANLFYRNRWTGFESAAPSTLFFTANAPLKKQSMALGVKLEHRSHGAQNYTGIYFDYAYRIQLGSGKLSMALEGGIYSGSIDNLSVRDDEFDQALNDNNNSFILPNFGVGGLYYSKFYWISISVPRLLGYESKESGESGIKVAGVARDYILAGGASVSINNDFDVEPSAFFKYNSGEEFLYMINAVGVYKNRYKAGLGYKSFKALAFLLAFDANRQLSIAYSFDLNFEPVSSLGKTSHEIHLRYTFGYNVTAADPRGF